MEKVCAFTIAKLRVCGFKCFAEPAEFAFGDLSAITGGNGQGKSSIADAIAYALTGTPYFGEGRLDRLYAEGAKRMRVALDMRFPDGRAHTLVRERVKDQTSLVYDGLPVRQSDLTVMFGEKDLFLSIFNPLHFTEALGEGGRSLLERYLPAVPHERVLEALDETDRALLANERIASPEGFLKSLREEIKEIERDIVYTEGQRDLLRTQAKEAEAALSKKRGELAETEDRISALESKRTEGIDLTGMKESLADLYARHDEAMKEAPAPADTSEIDEELLALSKRLAEKRAACFVSGYAKETATAEARFEATKKRYKSESAVLAKLAPGIRCPVCKRSVTEENVGAIKESFKESLNALAAEGRTRKGELAALAAFEEKARAEFEEFKAEDIARLEAEAAELEKKRDIVLAEAEGDAKLAPQRREALKERIASLEAAVETGNLSEGETAELKELCERKSRLAAEIGFAESGEPPAQNPKGMSVEALRASAKEKKRIEAAVKCLIAERVKLRFSDFDMLNRVRLLLCETVKSTGEIKDVFRLSYDGRPYVCLSLSEKIKTGLEISALLQRLSGVVYPVFIDNGESIPVIDNVKPKGQIFVASVVKAAPLAVRAIDNAQPAAAA
jgi:DNA repair exonuclease SbcCD ATPase subunit